MKKAGEKKGGTFLKKRVGGFSVPPKPMRAGGWAEEPDDETRTSNI